MRRAKEMLVHRAQKCAQAASFRTQRVQIALQSALNAPRISSLRRALRDARSAPGTMKQTAGRAHANARNQPSAKLARWRLAAQSAPTAQRGGMRRTQARGINVRSAASDTTVGNTGAQYAQHVLQTRSLVSSRMQQRARIVARERFAIRTFFRVLRVTLGSKRCRSR
jgi:hypothetical protein